MQQANALDTHPDDEKQMFLRNTQSASPQTYQSQGKNLSDQWEILASVRQLI